MHGWQKGEAKTNPRLIEEAKYGEHGGGFNPSVRKIFFK